MSFTKKFTLSLFLLTASLHAAASSMQQSNNPSLITPQEKSIALQMIELMQEFVDFNNNLQKQLFASNIAKSLTGKTSLIVGTSSDSIAKKYDDTVKKTYTISDEIIAVYHKYINKLRQTYNNIKRPAFENLPNTPEATNLIEYLTIQSNQSKFMFTHLLDEYVAHLGNVYEKKSGLLGLYRNVYSITSSEDQNLSITPNEYIALVQTLQSATGQGNWDTTINITLPVIQESGSIVEKNLTLNEIISAIKQVPLPTSYYATALKVSAGVATVGALGAGAYYAYNNPEAFNFLQGKVTDIEQQLDETPVDNHQAIVEQFGITEEELADMTKPKTVQNWQAGGDAENYGLSGYSDLDSQGVTALLPAGQITGNAAKAGVNAAKTGAVTVGTRLGLTGQSALKEVAIHGSSAAKAVASKKALPSVTLPATSTLAQARIGAQLENLPTGYVQPAVKVTMETTKNVSPRWAVNFGQ